MPTPDSLAPSAFPTRRENLTQACNRPRFLSLNVVGDPRIHRSREQGRRRVRFGRYYTALNTYQALALVIQKNASGPVRGPPVYRRQNDFAVDAARVFACAMVASTWSGA